MVAMPKIAVFDLDYTLWPYWCDTHIDPPFRRSDRDGTIRDAMDRVVKCYPEVSEVLSWLRGQGVTLGVASRTGEVRGANQLITLFGWDQHFSHKEIYPGSKIAHFKKIKRDSGVGFHEMLFFDDERRNKIDLDKIGVMTVMVDERVGVTMELVQTGLRQFAARAAAARR